MARTGQPKKIAILGGGVGAISAAFALTSDRKWQDNFDITVYQLGWRLGGKGASARKLDEHARIQEHGLHIWFGYYENAFRMMRECYRELTGYERSWEEAFMRHDFVVLEEYVNGRWLHQPMDFARNDELPGQRTPLALDAWDYISMIFQLMRNTLTDPERAAALAPAGTAPPWIDEPRWWRRIESTFQLDQLSIGLDLLGYLDIAHHMTATLRKTFLGARMPLSAAIVALLERARREMGDRLERALESDDAARRLWTAFDLGATVIRGMLVDEIFINGFDSIDDQDFAAWLQSHGASRLTLESGLVRTLYDQAFAFRRGDAMQLVGAAGTLLRAVLRMLFTYRGSVMWKLQGSMGDVIFAPLYRVLKQRGVKFEFFHRVQELHLSGDKTLIDRISMSRQVRLKHDEYDPLIDDQWWPDTPRYEQINGADARELQRRAINLESYWSTWKETPRELKRGRDFDLVVLGISLGALPGICRKLVAANPRWRDMINRVETVRTQAFQLWLAPTLRELGWQLPSSVSTGYTDPLNTWADMTHTAAFERWPGDSRPGCVAYFCGPMADDETQEPDWFTHPDFPRQKTEEARQQMQQFLARDILYLWPKFKPADIKTSFCIANVEPTERYVLSVPGSTQFRLPSDDSGFGNLYLAGDWTKNGLNAGCVEAAVMSGFQVSRKIAGYPQRVIGEKDFE